MNGSKPRVHWVSPVPPAQTDIAHYTNRILPELAETCDLVLWTDAPKWDKALERVCEVRQLDPDNMRPRDFANAGQGRGSDVVFVNIGNSWVFHSGMARMIQRIPSVVVLHDIAVQELFFHAIGNGLFPRDVYDAGMARWYGARGAEQAQAHFTGGITPFDLALEMPGYQIVLGRAVAALTHTPMAEEAVTGMGTIPAYRLDLPFRPSAPAARSVRTVHGPLKFVQFGYIGPNRRLLQVLEALAPIRDEIPFRFDIMGQVWDPDFIRSRIRRLGLQDQVELHGFVPEPVLDARLAEAHLVFNLRHPTMGEASGSQLRIWNASAASVVTDQGWYGSLPDDTVFKLPLEGEAGALQSLVRKIGANRTIGQRLGEAGRARLESHHTPALYAEGIAQLARQVAADTGPALLAQSADRVMARGPVPSDLYRKALRRRV